MLKTNRGIIKLFLLSIITCGIYGIIFWWSVCEDLNTTGQNDGKDSPNIIVVYLLSVITCGIYYYFWLYKQGNRLQITIQDMGGTCQENGTTLLLWELVGIILCGLGPIIGTYIFIKNLNQACALYNQRVIMHS